MPWKLCVHPLKRTFGRLPLKRTPKNKTRQRMQGMKKQRNTLEMQTAKHEPTIAEQEDLLMACSKERSCFICFEGGPPLMQSGCACRGEAGLVHLDCRIKAAEALVRQRNHTKWWFKCQTCEQSFTGPMLTGLVNAWFLTVRDRAKEDRERLAVAGFLASTLFEQGGHAGAEEKLREVLEVQTLVLGAEHPDTLSTAGNLASTLIAQDKHTEAEEMLREVLARMKLVLGEEHPITMLIAINLAVTLSEQDKPADAEHLEREVLAMQKRVLGAEHCETLKTMHNLANSLYEQGKHTEAKKMLCVVLTAKKRVLGVEHPSTVLTNTLAAGMK